MNDNNDDGIDISDYNTTLDAAMSKNPTNQEVVDAGVAVYDAALAKAEEQLQDTNELQKDDPRIPRGYGDTGTGSGGVTEEQRADLIAKLLWIIPRYGMICSPDPSEFVDLIDSIKETADAMDSSRITNGQTYQKHIRNAHDDIGEWRGPVRDAFQTNFLGSLEEVMDHQGTVAKMLEAHARAMAGLYARKRRESITISEKTVAALNAITNSMGAGSILKTLGVLVALGTIGSAAGGGAGFSLAMAALAGGSSAASPFVEEGEELEFGADSVEGVLDNMQNALAKNDQQTSDEEDKIIEAIGETARDLERLLSPETPRKDNPIVPFEPDEMPSYDSISDGELKPAVS